MILSCFKISSKICTEYGPSPRNENSYCGFSLRTMIEKSLLTLPIGVRLAEPNFAAKHDPLFVQYTKNLLLGPIA